MVYGAASEASLEPYHVSIITNPSKAWLLADDTTRAAVLAKSSSAAW